MSAAYQEIVSAPSAFDRATETFAALKAHMRTAEAMRMTHGELESHVIEKTRTIARDILQGHLDLRTGAERVVHVVGDDGIVRDQSRASSRQLRTLVGEVVLGRILYQAAGAHGLAPQDAALSLAKGNDDGTYQVVDETLHQPIDQALVVCKRGVNQAVAKEFVNAMAMGHDEDIADLQSARPRVGARVKGVIDDLLPVLREHREIAGRLAAELANAPNEGD